MKCEMCGREPELIVLFPKRQPDGKLVTLACEGCSVESGMYCPKHQRPHMGFNDETTACVLCEVIKRVAKEGAGVILPSESSEEV